MPLSSGERLGPYEILRPIGAGGMGEVYTARDTRLKRTVAIKVLPPCDAGNPEQRMRLLHEARAVSALNHPGIVTIHDVLSEAERDALVMEYVVGNTLASRIGHKGLPLKEALSFAIQIADALSAAHAAGVVHRDLKPGNIMVNEKGLIKVLDFGLAKLTGPPESGECNTTQTILPATEEGTIVGTVAYMSPEQAEGKKVDSRSDVFSFGSVLYEMTTGARAFQEPTKVATISAILNLDPRRPSDITPSVPPELERIISQCQRKDPSRRFQHMDDIKVQLEDLRDEVESIDSRRAQPGQMHPRRSWWRTAVLSAVVTLGALAATWWFMPGQRGGEASGVMPLMSLTSDTGLTTDPVVSPDGKLVVYASDRAGADNLDIWIKQIDGGVPLRLTSDAADEHEPSFSPDGSRIVFRSERDGGGIYTIPALGGEPRLIAKAGRQARFSPDGARIAFVTGLGGPGGVAEGELFVVPAGGGTPRKLVPSDVGAENPVWSPDGRSILFAAGKYRIENWAIVPSDLAEPISLDQFESAIRTDQSLPVTFLKLDDLKKAGLGELTPYQWLPGNRLLFSAKSGDTSNVFDIALSPPAILSKNWRLGSSPRRLTFGTGFDQGASFSTAGGGRLVFASLVRKENVWSVRLAADHPAAGAELRQLTKESGFHIFPAVSKDGKKVAYVSHAAYNDEVWLLDVQSGRKSVLSTAVSSKSKVKITPDGTQVFYGENVSRADFGVNAVPVAGGGPDRVCQKCSAWVWDWSPDRRRMLTWRKGKTTVAATLYNLETGDSNLFLEYPQADLYEFEWSPDGRRLAFLTRNANKRVSRVFTAPYSGDQGPTQDSWIAVTDGSSLEDKLRWSPNGEWIYSLSNRDGFQCIWAYSADRQTKSPAPAPVAVFHSHAARLSIGNANLVSQEISVGTDKLVFNMGETTGNIWMTTSPQTSK